jgi:hypothetical protein
LRPTPARAIWLSESLSRSSWGSPNRTRPSSGRVLPVTISMKVVLPAPFGPMMARSSCPPISNDRLLIALNPSNETEIEVTSRSALTMQHPS